jgi:site-specific DNA-methyltransferase (adenine-specific)
MELKIEYVDINSIKPYKNNAKLHPKEQIEQIKKSIEEFGMDDPIGIWKDEIVEGHGRLIACKELGMETVPIIRLDHLTDEERKAYTLAHNKLTMNSDFDIDILNDELMNSFDTIDMSDFGFDIDLGLDEEQEIVEDEVPEVPEEPKAKLGDIYQLGNHRLMCGDSTNEEDVEKLMDGVKADMVFTDPPYNVDYSNAERPKASKTDLGRIKNDTMSEDDFIYFLGQVYKRLDENTKDNSSFYIWYASKETIAFYSALLETNIILNQQIIWKKPMLLGRGKYQWAHEPCIFAIKGSPYFTEDRTKTTVWDFGGYDKSKNVHPTQKPLFLPAEAINNSSKKEDTVLDLFGGSGSTLIACEQLNRKCYMMELDPHYIDVIIQRWENFTGEKAVKIN